MSFLRHRLHPHGTLVQIPDSTQQNKEEGQGLEPVHPMEDSRRKPHETLLPGHSHMDVLIFKRPCAMNCLC